MEHFLNLKEDIVLLCYSNKHIFHYYPHYSIINLLNTCDIYSILLNSNERYLMNDKILLNHQII